MERDQGKEPKRRGWGTQEKGVLSEHPPRRKLRIDRFPLEGPAAFVAKTVVVGVVSRLTPVCLVQLIIL